MIFLYQKVESNFFASRQEKYNESNCASKAERGLTHKPKKKGKRERKERKGQEDGVGGRKERAGKGSGAGGFT